MIDSKKGKIVLLEQNGIKQPKVGTVCRKIWDLSTEMSLFHKRTISRAELIDTITSHNEGKQVITLEGWEGFKCDIVTAKAQYRKWREFHGIVGVTVPNPAKLAKKAAKVAEKATKLAEKEATKATKNQTVNQE